MTIMYKDYTFLQSLYMAKFRYNYLWQKIDLPSPLGRGYRGGITQKYFLKIHKTKKGETLWL